MKGRWVRIFLVALLITSLALAGCGGQKEQKAPAGEEKKAEKVTLKVGHVLAPTHPYQLGLEHFAKLVNEKTGGKVEVQVFHSAQLGNEREMIEGLQMGTLDMTLVSTAPISGFSNVFLALDLPYILESREQAYKVLDGPIGQEMLKALQEKNIIGLAFWENGFRHVTNSKLPIRKPEDLKGLKIRTMENPIHMASFKIVGADPTPMAFGELFTALQQKTIDGQENPLPIIYTSRFYEVQKYVSLTGHFYAAAPLLISKAVWDKLAPEYREAIQKAAVEARDYERSLVKKLDGELASELKAKGMEIIEPDREAFKNAMKPVWKQFENQIGKEVLERIIKEIGG